MPPTSWVELALAGLAEARGHDGRGHRENCAFSFFRFFRENENIKKLYVFERVEPQLRHLEPVGGKSTLAHLSVHFHISMHILKIPSTWIISNASEPCGTLRNPKEHFFLTARSGHEVHELAGRLGHEVTRSRPAHVRWS